MQSISLLAALIVEDSHILAGIYIFFLKDCPRLNLKRLSYQIWTSVKKIAKLIMK